MFEMHAAGSTYVTWGIVCRFGRRKDSSAETVSQGYNFTFEAPMDEGRGTDSGVEATVTTLHNYQLQDEESGLEENSEHDDDDISVSRRTYTPSSPVGSTGNK